MYLHCGVWMDQYRLCGSWKMQVYSRMVHLICAVGAAGGRD